MSYNYIIIIIIIFIVRTDWFREVGTACSYNVVFVMVSVISHHQIAIIIRVNSYYIGHGYNVWTRMNGKQDKTKSL